MKAREQVKRIIESKGGIAKAADFISAGISPSEILNLCSSGMLNRVCHGYYELSDNAIVSEEQLLAMLIPKGIVCAESALFHYGYSDFVPRKWSIAIPRTMSREKLKIDVLPINPHYMQDNLYELGKTKGDFCGVTLSVYDRERAICDCFRYRARLDSEVFNRALNAYAKDKNKNLENLSFYAKELRVYKKVKDIMGVLLYE